MMSSPIQQSLSMGQFANAVTDSPLKPSSYYFQSDNNNDDDDDDDDDDRGHNSKTFRHGNLIIESEISQQFIYSNETDDDSQFVVPVSHRNNDPDFTKHHDLQYPGKLNRTSDSAFHISSSNHSEAAVAAATAAATLYSSNETQSNLYPPMDFNSTPAIRESASSNTIYSVDSVPLLTSSLISSSISDNSICSPVSFQNASTTTTANTTTMTPHRTLRRASSSLTPLTSIYKTPSQPQNPSFAATSPVSLHKGVTPSRRPKHRRTRSRLSLDANGSAAIITINTANAAKSPMATGTNPFYTPPAFLSPHQGSPATTPLVTPSVKREFDNFSSISPQMLMNPGDVGNNGDHRDQNSIFTAAADLTMKLAASRHSVSTFNSLNDHSFLCDPLNSEITMIPHAKIAKTESRPSISKSHSSINLVSLTDKQLTDLNDPHAVTKFDILKPRRRVTKSVSTTNLNENGKKPKKVHSCPLCNAIFQRPEHVKRHMRSHSSEKPYSCDEPGCGKKFNRGDNLKAHLRKIHHLQI